MHLLSATDDFTIARQPRPGFPILLWEDMNSCWQANEFLRYYLLRGAIGSQNSWEPVGRALYDYFSFLEAHELSWDDVIRVKLGASSRQSRSAKQEELNQEREKNKVLRKQLEETKNGLAKLASINEVLLMENKLLRAKAGESKVVDLKGLT